VGFSGFASVLLRFSPRRGLFSAFLVFFVCCAGVLDVVVDISGSELLLRPGDAFLCFGFLLGLCCACVCDGHWWFSYCVARVACEVEPVCLACVVIYFLFFFYLAWLVGLGFHEGPFGLSSVEVPYFRLVCGFRFCFGNCVGLANVFLAVSAVQRHVRRDMQTCCVPRSSQDFGGR